MVVSGMLKGLKHEYSDPLQYYIRIGEEETLLNDHLGQDVRIHFEGQIECVYCGRKIRKTFNNGSCYPCFKKLPQNDLCIVKPHLCHYEQGTCRDEAFGETQCMIPHYVYLALSSSVKVGITRKHNEYKRWGDQGALQAIVIAEVPTRKMAGELEMVLAEHMNDKTNWRKMLKGEVSNEDLLAVREKVQSIIPETFRPFLLSESEMIHFHYPVLEKLDKIKSYNFDKTPSIEDRLIGIKGQYLMFDHGVINMKKYAGYYVTFQSVS